jgi:hypothetical protein
MNMRKCFSARGVFFSATLVVACIPLLQSAAQAQSLTASANPPTGLAGFNDSYVTGSGFPAGTITGSSVAFATSCATGTIVATAPVIQVAVEGVLRRFEFLIPASLKSGVYYLWVSGTAGSTPFNTLNTPSCSEITVTATTTTLAACVPTSSLGVVAGTNVDAYVPFGYWEGGRSGIERVPLEGTDTALNFPTSGIVNSCASNSVTGEVVCTENTNKVDLINGATLTTITSGSNEYAAFTGGSCENCGVGINAANNTAVIAMGLAGGGYDPYGGNTGVQVLNLATNTFNTPFPMAHTVSEDISIDSGRNLILSPGEDGVYDLLQIGAGNTLTEFGSSIGGTLDSAAEDCTTGIALSSYEFTNYVYITDLTQATFIPGSPGTWTAPGQFLDLAGSYAAGTSGISSAPGSSHLGVVTGEFGGSSYSALLLPSTSGSGTPTLADYAFVGSMPNTPDGAAFVAGFDPHTVTAYTSPNTNKSYAVFADYAPGYPNWLGVVDLACVLAQPRSGNIVTGNASACTTYVAVP